MTAPYPLVFVPQLKPKVWGGGRLAGLGKAVPSGVSVGESWEVCDLDETSASGGGGGRARSVIANGPLSGRTIREAIDQWGDALLEHRRLMAGAFPLLVKYLDARENLSVQVHPSEAYARVHPGAHLKTEAWYVVEAEPGSEIHAGLRPEVTRAGLESRRRGEGFEAGLVDDLIHRPARVGECHVLPSGTCHARGGGVLVAEVQTPSDTTFRMYDWGREAGGGRSLHPDEALECAALGPAPGVTRGPGRLATTPFFTIDEWRLDGRVTGKEGCSILMVVEGQGRLEWEDGPSRGELALGRGTTALIPAKIGSLARLDGRGTVLCIGV